MVLKFKNNFRILMILLITTFLVRFFPVDFPKFTVEEARIVYRGYTLAKYGTDEIGRRYPLIFNSLEDYQLPAVSYLTAAGIFVFGKNDLGARIPFVLIGTFLAFLTYEIAKSFSSKASFRLISAILVSSSPVLIFLSKIPNTAIVLTFMFTLLFYLLVNKRHIILVIFTMIFTVLVSKFAWFILLPFLLYTFCLFKPKKGWKNYFILIISAILILLSTIFLFVAIPQSKRSLTENNFSLFSDITIKNGINKLRGQGTQSSWPVLVDRLLFNKLNFLIVGLLHWLSHFDLSIYFGQFDETGQMNFSYLGAWTKILILPAVLGLFSILRKGNRESKLFLLLPLLLTYPSVLIYPKFTVELVVLTLPFIAIIMAFGFLEIIQFKRKIAVLIFFLIILELGINIYNFLPEYKNTNQNRPGWIKKVVSDIFETSKNNPTAVSDDIVSDITPFFWWYTLERSESNNLDIRWPYKYRQYNLPNIKIIVSDGKFHSCGKNEKILLFVSKRDLNKIKREFNVKPIGNYRDNLEEENVFQMPENICLD